MAQRFGPPGGTAGLMSIDTIGTTGGSQVGLAQSFRRNREEEAERKRQQDLAVFMQTMSGKPSLQQLAAQSGAQFMSGGNQLGQGPRETMTPGTGLGVDSGQIDIRRLAGLQSPQFQNAAMQFAMDQAQAAQRPVTPQPGFTLSPGQTRFGPQGAQVANVPAAAPPPQTASQGISQKKLDRINVLQGKVEAGNATKSEETQLDKMLGGVSPVQINFGRSTGAERTALAETEANIDSLDNLQKIYNKKGVKSGPVSGRINPITGLAGLTSDNQEEFMAASASLKNRVIQEITGAQMSEAEVVRIEGEIPLTTDPPARWKAKFAQTRKNLKMMQKRRQQVLQKSGITNPLTGQAGQTGGGSQQFQTISDEDLLRMIGGQ